MIPGRTFTVCDGTGCVSQPQSTALTATFGYDNEGRMTSVQYPSWGPPGQTGPGPNLGYTYDSMGRLSGMTDLATNAQIISSAGYGPANELLQMTGQWGTETRSYNSMLQLTQLTSGYNVNIAYYYYNSSQNNNGKITSQVDAISGEQVNYTYDSLNRLATAVTSDNPNVAQWGQSFTYDGFGNLTDQTTIKGTAPEMHTSYDPATNHGSCTDANGNPGITCGPFYSYDIENRVTEAGIYGAPAYYSYAPGNKRVWKGLFTVTSYSPPEMSQTSDEITFWSVNGQKLATYQLSANTLTEYPPGGLQFYAPQSGTCYYFGSKLIKNAQGYVHTDRLGSIGKFYPYGVERPSATQNGTEKFTGYFRDAETGLDYAVNRYEQPGTGRFLTPDPYGGSAKLADPGSWNRFSYTGGDPLNNSDPSGLDEGPPESGCYFSGIWMPGCWGAIFQFRFVRASSWEKALTNLVKAQQALEDRDGISDKCQQDLNALSQFTNKAIDWDAIQAAIQGTTFANGVTSTLPVSALFGPGDDQAGASFQYQEDKKYGPGQEIKDEFGRNPFGLTAKTVLDGNTFFINPGLIFGDINDNEALLLHESLHELGIDDASAQKALGLTVDEKNTANITRKLKADCVNGKGNAIPGNQWGNS